MVHTCENIGGSVVVELDDEELCLINVGDGTGLLIDFSL